MNNAIYTDDFAVTSLGIQEQYVYDIEVEDNHNFFANDIAVHNSIYLRLGNLVDKYCQGKSQNQILDFLIKVSNNMISPFIEKSYDELFDLMGAYKNAMVMEREVIARKGIWTAKKRYILSVLDNEGVRYSPYKLKIMGLETARSSTPNIIRDSLKSAIDVIINGDESDLIQYIETMRTDFMQMNPEDIAFPRSVTNLVQYSDPITIYAKGAPIAVKASLIHNHYVGKKGLSKKYNDIRDGDKIKFIYLKTPNPTGGVSGMDHVIAFENNLPPEFDLLHYIDYDKMFQKSFLDPLRTIVEAIGWNFERTTTLEDFFG